MESTTYALAGRSVHRIGFGAMQLPGKGVFGPPADRDHAIAVLRRAVDAGVDHIDTAQFYGPDVANELIRAALHPYPENLVIVSKVGARRDGNGAWLPAQRPEQLRSAVEDNLRSLSLDQVPVVNLRRHDAGEVGLDDQLEEMIAMRDEGLIAGVGISNVNFADYEHARSRTDIACVQNAFNVVDRSAQDVFEATREAGVPFVPFFPLGSAFTPDKPVLSAQPVQDIARRLGVTAAQVAIAWLLALAPNVLLIPGTASLTHLDENLAASQVVLDQEAMGILETAGVS
jgi:pyridoxine 4-dehydrogenase